MKSTVLFLVGPTAVGKSRIGLLLAKKLNGEIISADSMLVYRGMNIGTAKPTKAEQKQIPHHLIDIIEPSKQFSVFQYRRRALRKLKEISKQGRLPIVVGGSGLYVRALLRGIAPFPVAHAKLRAELENELKIQGGLERLGERLRALDPLKAASIDLSNPRRVIRSLEIALHGKEEVQRLPPKQKSLRDLGFDPIIIGITKDRAALYQDIEMRVDRMFKKGLVREVRKLLKGKLSKTARQAVGYKELIGFIEGHYEAEYARELVKINTRHLAKRQWTWFKREEGIQWLELSAKQPLRNAADEVMQLIQRQGK